MEDLEDETFSLVLSHLEPEFGSLPWSRRGTYLIISENSGSYTPLFEAQREHPEACNLSQ